MFRAANYSWSYQEEGSIKRIREVPYRFETKILSRNPIESVEDLIFAQDWPSQRLGNEEVMAEINGRWCEYHLHFVWNEAERTLQFFVMLVDIDIPKQKLKKVYELVCLINEKLNLGHFEVFGKINTPVFRHALLLPGTRTISEALLEEMLNTALETCERFYPAFQFVIFGDKDPQDAACMSMIDIAGEA